MGENIDEFELLLQKRSKIKLPSIYNAENRSHNLGFTQKCQLTPKVLLSSVATSIKSMQKGDSVKINKNIRKNLAGHKNTSLACINTFKASTEEPTHRKVQSNMNKFETQCFTDTELINAIDKVEELYKTRTEDSTMEEKEMEATMLGDCNKEKTRIEDENIIMKETDSISEGVIEANKSRATDETRTEDIATLVKERDVVMLVASKENENVKVLEPISSTKTPNILEDDDIFDDYDFDDNICVVQTVDKVAVVAGKLKDQYNDEQFKENSVTLFLNDTIISDNEAVSSTIIPKDEEHSDSTKNLNVIEDTAIEHNKHICDNDSIEKNREVLSPVFDTAANKDKKMSPNITCDLSTFEDFENIVNTVIDIENIQDFDEAKNMIGSQKSQQMNSSKIEDVYENGTNNDIYRNTSCKSSYSQKYIEIHSTENNNIGIEDAILTHNSCKNDEDIVLEKKLEKAITGNNFIDNCIQSQILSSDKSNNLDIIFNDDANTIRTDGLEEAITENNYYDTNLIQSQILGMNKSNKLNRLCNNDADKIRTDSFKKEAITGNNKSDFDVIQSQILGAIKIDKYNLEPEAITVNNDCDDPVFLDNTDNGRVKREATTKQEKDITAELLKDEILFSSDDESDYINKENHSNHDLPLTIALETSFYANQSALDKTLCLGFMTANHKTIEVSMNAFESAKSVFKGEDLEMSMKDLVERCERRSSKIESMTPKIEGFSVQQYVEDNEVKNTFVGFKTASNKDIKLSAQAKDRIKKVFQDIDLSDAFGDEGLGDKVNVEKSNTSNEIKKDQEVFKDLEFEEFDLSQLTDLQEKDAIDFKFVGFTTASNKKIEISDKAIGNAQNVFKDIIFGNTTDELSLKGVRDTNTNDDKSQKAEFNNEESKTRPENEESMQLDAIDNEKFVGFTTASNKKIEISAKALERTKKLFQDIDLEEQIDKKVENNNQSNAELKQEVIFKKPAFVGFQSASKKKVNICAQALKKSKRIFQNLDTEEKVGKVAEYAGFQTASNNAIKISQKALEKSKSIFQEDQPNDEIKNFKPSNSKQTFVGFKTASEKNIKISSQALNKIKNIFHDIDIGDLDESSTDIEETNINENVVQEQNADEARSKSPVFFGFQTANAKQVKMPERVNNEDSFKNIFTEDLKIDKDNVFKGFQTASNKRIKISEEALAKTRHFYKDIDENHSDAINSEPKNKPFQGFCTGNNKNVEISQEALEKTKNIFNDTPVTFNGFQTASKKKVSVTAQALEKTKNLFQDINTEYEKNNSITKERTKNNIQSIRHDRKPIVEEKAQENTDVVLDTQIQDNFNQSLCTEDFCETPKEIKRIGSPILSCPNAKRRKSFRTPYKENAKKIILADKIKETSKKTFEFDANYKKDKVFKLADLQKMENKSNTKDTRDDNLTKYTFDTLSNIVFCSERSLTNTDMTIQSLKEIFLENVSKKIVPEGWLDIQIKLVLWKLISYEIKYPKVMKNVCTAKNVLDQLKYRYDRELYNVQRPALRKIFEKDEAPNKSMVLCVASFLVDGVNVARYNDINKPLELLLTDGWYTIIASIDRMLTKLVFDGKIKIGCKIVTSGSELMNCEQGRSPWEDISAVRLKIHGNSTRLARWDTRLGFCRPTGVSTALSNVKTDGGKVSKVTALVTRVYPTLYVEKFDDGSTVTRSEKLEQSYQITFEAERQMMMEKIYEEVEKDLSDQDSQDSYETMTSSGKRKSLESGSQIAKMMKKSRDPMEFRSNLTSTQMHLLNDYNTSKRDRILQDIQDRVRKRIEEKHLKYTRNVVSLLKIRIAAMCERDGDIDVCKGMMSIWRPSDAVLEILKEGEWMDIMNVIPTAVRYSEIQLSAGKNTVFCKSKRKITERTQEFAKNLQRRCSDVKELVCNPSKGFDSSEIDTYGIIVKIDPSNDEFEKSKQQFQNLYLADLEKNIVCINFWGGIKKFGYQNVLDTGQVVFCANLQKRAGNTRKTIPQFRVTEFSVFTKTPRNPNVRLKMGNLEESLKTNNKLNFLSECVKNCSLNSPRYGNTENVSPFLGKNKTHNDSSLQQINIEEFNLSESDFEATFRQKDTQNMSPELLLRKKHINEKINKLKIYGEPPKLSRIQIKNKSLNASSSYKSPLSVASSKKNNMGDISPILNRAVAKNVKPIKLDFSANNDVGFTQDFDASPPLSLD